MIQLIKPPSLNMSLRSYQENSPFGLANGRSECVTAPQQQTDCPLYLPPPKGPSLTILPISHSYNHNTPSLSGLSSSTYIPGPTQK